VRIGLIGAGQMGTDILVQTAHMPGIEVVAAADASPTSCSAACTTAGDGPRARRWDDTGAGRCRDRARPPRGAPSYPRRLRRAQTST
jgi:predicted homoserine dehydrogenase-like protein